VGALSHLARITDLAHAPFRDPLTRSCVAAGIVTWSKI
jgi:hypothetical protein